MLRRLFVTFFMLSVAAAPAAAVVELDLSSARKAVALLRDRAGVVKFAAAPGLLSMRDPRCPTDSSLQITASGETETISLPCQNWQFRGTSYRYDDPTGRHGGVRLALWKSQVLVIKFQGDEWERNPPVSGPISQAADGIQVRLNVHDKSYCGRFSADTNQTGFVIGRNVTQCDPLPTPTSTPLATNTPTNTVPPTDTPTQPGPTNTPTHTHTFTHTPTNTPIPTPPPQIGLSAPSHGVFVDPLTQSTALVIGSVTNPVPGMEVRVYSVTNPAGIQVGVAPNGGFSTVVSLDADAIFNPIRAELVVPSTGFVTRDRHVVIYSDSVPDSTDAYPIGGSASQREDAGFSTEAIALRINDSGFDVLEGTIGDLVGFDPAELMPVGTMLDLDVDSLDSVEIISPAPTITGFGIEIDSMTNFIVGDITINNLRVDMHVEATVLGFIPAACDVRIRVQELLLFGDYDLAPDPTIPTNVDVNLIGALDAVANGFSHEFTDGTCDFFSGIINLFIGDLKGDLESGLESFLADPDGSGPQDSAIADAIEEALAEIEISGPIGDQLGLLVETPIFAIPEDNVGITLNTDARMTAPSVAPGAPNLAGSVDIAATFPSFGSTTPVNGLPYHLGLCIGSSAFNQLLKGITEAGQLTQELTELDLGGGPSVVTAGTLSIFLPELAQFDPATPMKIKLLPELGPIVNGELGPGGELAKLVISHLRVELVACEGGDPAVCEPTDTETLVMGGATDVEVGFDLDLDPGPPAGLTFALSEPSVDDITIIILDNPLGLNETAITDVLPAVFAPLLPTLGSAFGSIPVPSFFGLNACFVEASRNGDFLSIFLNLSTAPCP